MTHIGSGIIDGMTTATRIITAEELFAMGDIGRCELINGEIVHIAPAGAEHGGVTVEIAWRIAKFVHDQKLGRVYAAETGFTIARNPDVTRAPDVGFVCTERLPQSPRRGFLDDAPDLAIEVVSPGDTKAHVTQKVDQWLASGATSVWVVDPINRSVEIYRSPNQILRHRDGDTIRDEPMLPGFTLTLADIFAA